MSFGNGRLSLDKATCYNHLEGAGAVTKRYQKTLRPSRSKRRRLETEFTGPEVTPSGRWG